jgi:predicted metal-dependent phosphoesterase TrpH
MDLLAVTDHQSFDYCDAVIAAAGTPGRTLTVLPGIEMTSHEGVHVLAVFPQSYGAVERFVTWA